MVRINLIEPKYLTDQHLVAEYCEILILLGQIRQNFSTDNIPAEYCLGKGHISFFKDKLAYLKQRHEQLKSEMKNRNFKPTKTVNLKDYPKKLINDWRPRNKDFKLIKQRIKTKINLKPKFYRYYSQYRSKKFLTDLLKSA